MICAASGSRWFERSGHEPFVDEPAKFNALMAELVRQVLPSDLSACAASP